MTTRREQLHEMVAAANAARRGGHPIDPGLAPVLGDPDRRLVAYGTLRPGEPNQHVLADCRGTWMAATVTGGLGTWHGFPILRPDREGEPIAVMVLESPDLPHVWSRLDRFEGPAYRREWIVFVHDRGHGVGSVYVAR